MLKEYDRKPKRIKAIQYTGKNVEEIRDVFGDVFGDVFVYIGDYVVYDEDNEGEPEIIDGYDFEDDYEEVKEESE